MIKRLIKFCLFNVRGIKVDIWSLVFGKLISNHNEKGYPLVIKNSIVGNLEFKEGCKLINCYCLGNVKIGRFVSIFGPGTIISSIIGKIYIGNFCSIGQNVTIQESFHNYNNVSTYLFGKNIFRDSLEKDFLSKGDIKIEDDVWIGSNASILSGVTIGRGAIIGAGAVVTKNVEPYSIMGGNPAKFIRYRFSKEKMASIEKSEWWNWDLKKILKSKDFFRNPK